MVSPDHLGKESVMEMNFSPEDWAAKTLKGILEIADRTSGLKVAYRGDTVITKRPWTWSEEKMDKWNEENRIKWNLW